MQELLIEVWHHCPRSQMVAAALSQGGTTAQQDLKYRDIFLGSGFAPLHALLNKPQVPGLLLCAAMPASLLGTCRLGWLLWGKGEGVGGGGGGGHHILNHNLRAWPHL